MLGVSSLVLFAQREVGAKRKKMLRDKPGQCRDESGSDGQEGLERR